MSSELPVHQLSSSQDPSGLTLSVRSSLSKRTPSPTRGMSTLKTSGFLQYLGDIENFTSPSKSPRPYHVSLGLEKQTLLPLLILVSLGLSPGTGILMCPCPPPGYLENSQFWFLRSRTFKSLTSLHWCSHCAILALSFLFFSIFTFQTVLLSAFAPGESSLLWNPAPFLAGT